MALASRSVKKCQNWIVPDAVAPGEAIGLGFADGVHAATASAAVESDCGGEAGLHSLLLWGY
jgi:hypothetical protein